MSAIAIEGLTVRYGARAALDGVSLSVAEGSVYALLGRNGAGKSTLVRCLLGHLPPNSGQVTLLGRDAWSGRREALVEVGVVPEEPDAPPAMTAPELGRFCARLYPRWDGGGFAERLERFRVPRDVPFGRLSKGQKTQVGLALALAPAPRLLILDDPTLGLDPVARRSVFDELISELADRGVTVLLTTHDLAGAEGIADRVGILHGGRLLLDEAMEPLKRRFRRIGFPWSGAEERPGPDLGELAPVAVASSAWGVEAVVADYEEERVAPLRRLRPGAEVTALTLEEIFVALAGREEVA